MTYNPPVNDANTLYIDSSMNSFSFGELFTRITAHFGEDVKLNEFTISATREHVRGCSCHTGYDDYDEYIKVEREAKPWDGLKEVPLQDLVE